MGLKLVNINKSFGLGIGKPRKKVLNNVNLEIHDGEMVAIVGRRGSGKTTLMNIMTGLNRQDSGHYLIDGKMIGLGRTFLMANFRAKKCGIITKNSLLVPDMTIFDNITMPLNHRFMMSRKRKLKRAREVLRGLGLKGKGRFYPTEFSALDRQKICAGRAMIAEPKYIFADEPTAGFTASDVDRYMDFLEVLNSAGYTIIVFTYSKRVASHCHRMIPVTGEEADSVKEADADDFAEKPERIDGKSGKPVSVKDEEPDEEPVIEEPDEEPEEEKPSASPEVHEILGESIADSLPETVISPEEDAYQRGEEDIPEEEPAPKPKPARKPATRKRTTRKQVTDNEDE